VIGGPDWSAWRARVHGALIELGCPDREAAAEARRAEARMKARLAWLDALFARMRELHRAIGIFWCDFFDSNPDLDPDAPDEARMPPDPPEHAELEALEKALDDVRERDLWPRHLYFDAV
jgi:hypothetical protein